MEAKRVGAFLDALQSLNDPEEKTFFAKALLNRFDRQMLRKNQRREELKGYAATD